MMKLFTCLFSTLQVLLLPAVAAERYEPKIEASIEERWRWAELEALSGIGARCADEAEDGSIWFARRDEVVRYDGRNLEHYVLAGVPEGASVRDIHVSRAGDVYLLTDRYLAVLKDGVWRLLVEEETEDLFLEAISETADGDIWVGLNCELVRVRAGEVERFETGLANMGATVVDLHGRLWAAEARAGRILVYDLNDDRLSQYREFEVHGKSTGFCKIQLDTKDRVWVIKPDEEDRCFLFENYESRLAVGGLAANGLASSMVSISETPPGSIWFCVGRRLGELVGGDLKMHEVEDLPLPTSYPYVLGLSSNRLLMGGRSSKTFIIDLSDERWKTYRDLNFQCEDVNGGHWFLHHDGRVVRWQPETDEWLAYGESDELIDFPNRIFASSDGVVWVSGSHRRKAAVSWFVDGRWKRESFGEAGMILSHLGVVEAGNGSMLFGVGMSAAGQSNVKGGAVVFREEEGELVGSHISPPVFPRRTANLVERKNDGFWFGAASMTRRLGNGTLEPERIALFEDNWIDHLVVDGENNLWAALWGSGVYRYDGEVWSEFNERNGLGSDQVVCLLVGEVSGGIWAGTVQGLSRYDGAVWTNWELSGDATFLREDDTLRESSDGSLWLNYAYRKWLLEGNRDSAHAEVYRTTRYNADKVAPATIITHYESEIPEGGQFAIAWEARDAWSITKASELEYSWRLDDGEWSRFSRVPSAILDGIDGGNHSFEVRSRDVDWNVDPSPARAEFVVILPLWKRTWFILLCLAVVVAIVYLSNALFRTRLRAALAMEEFKLDFFTNVSHELRNPLAVIMGPLESLLSRVKDTEDRGLLQIALRNARKMQGLVDQLLQFRKLETGKSHYRPSRGEIIGFIRDAVEAESPLWVAKNQKVRVLVDSEYLECEYDSDKLQKILDNLLSNAIKYTPEGGEIDVGVKLEDADGSLIFRLWVEDNGKGIPQHEIELVSKPFYRVKGKGDEGEGFGLGLALVQQLVQLLSGEMKIESPVQNSNCGTRIEVILPLSDAGNSLGVEEIEADFEVEESGRGNRTRPCLLLVEDNLDLRHFMKGELANTYDILEASDGREGLALAIREDPDLIITDVMMPEMDGFEFCRQARSNTETSHMPIIILTAKSSEEHCVEGIEAGADSYFSKPLNMVQLRARVQHLLETRSRLKQLFGQRLILEPTELTVSSVDEAILRKAIKVVEARMRDQSFDVVLFAKEMAMSRTTLYRKLKALTGQGPNPFIRSMRLKRAAQLLKSGKVSVSEVLEYVGMLDLSYFSRVFKKEFGVPPSEYLTYLNSKSVQ